MAGTVATKILVRLLATREVALNGATQKAPASVEGEVSWPDGTGTSQNDEVWVENSGSVAAGAFDNLDLTALAQLDGDADTERTVNFSKVKAYLILNTSSTGNLVLGGGTDNAGAADAFAGVNQYPFTTDAALGAIPAGGYWFWSNPIGSSTTGANVLCLGGITATQTYEIAIVGNAA